MSNTYKVWCRGGGWCSTPSTLQSTSNSHSSGKGVKISENNNSTDWLFVTCKGQSNQHKYLKYVSEWHGPMGDTMDKQCLQDSLDVVGGMTYAGQAVPGHRRAHMTGRRHDILHIMWPNGVYYTAVRFTWLGPWQHASQQFVTRSNSCKAGTHCTTQCLLLVKSYLGA